MSFTQDECQQKLDKLLLWQEKQKRSLHDKQMEEKRLLCGTQQLHYDSFMNKSINNINCDIIHNKNTGISENENITKKTFLKRGEGLKSRFGVDPDRFKLNNLPKYKYSNKIRDTGKKTALNPQKSNDPVDKKEKNILGSKNRKELFTTNEIPKSSSHKLQHIVTSSSTQSKTKVPTLEEESDDEIKTWASVLDPTHTNPISISEFKGYKLSDTSLNERDQLNLFEILERKVNASGYSFNSTDIVELLKSTNLYPGDTAVASTVIADDPLLNQQDLLDNQLQTTLEPSPGEIDDLKLIDDDSDTDKCDSFHVRFSDKVIVNEINSEIDSEFEENNDTLKPLSTSITSTPNQKTSLHSEIDTDENFESIIEQILGLKQKEIQEKSQLLDDRLKELEHEIALFQQQNQILTKMKQEHELEKIEMDTMFQESKKVLDDEKIRIEIYLNDEKSKLNEEKLKIEKKLSQPNKRDREEIFRLQNQIIELKEEIKEKETKQSASQSRLRAQIRNLEKNLREKELEIENIKKENKKLEFENGRLRRQATSKMLNEINKNISKLAIANQSPPLTSKTNKHDHKDDKTKKSSGMPTTWKLKTDKTKKQVTSSSSSSTAASDSSSSDCEEDDVKTISTDRNSNISESTSIVCGQSEVSDTLKSLKREISNADGSKDIWYPNGNIKKISADGLNIKMLYYNKDIKETNINEGVVRYYYAETNTWHTQYLDGLEILEFPNGQTEHRYKDGKVAVHFENGSIKVKDPNDPEIVEEWRYADGTVAKIKINGEKNILLPNGQKEIHTADHKRREYPDGTVKIVYPDGSQETRYSNGRVRLKDKEGKLIMDSMS